MFKKKECKRCKTSYDETFSECPKCGMEDTELCRDFKNITMVSWPKQIALFVIGFAIFQVIAIFYAAIIKKASITGQQANMLLNTLVYVSIFLILIGVLNVDLKKLVKSFKYWQPYLAGVGCVFAVLALGYIYQLILAAAHVQIGTSGNESAIDSVTTLYPFGSIIVFGFIGPICEELTYRVGLFSFFKRISKWVAYPATIIIFTLIHFTWDAPNITNELLNLPFYVIGAVCLTFTYDKYGFAGSMTAHILNNVISLSLSMISIGVIR